jgi:deoxyribose-phosphate aldolase
MLLRPADLAKTLDHALLDPAAEPESIARVCAEAREHHVASVCVPPELVSIAAEHLRGCDVKVCAVIGLPFGSDSAGEKIALAEQAVADGAGEIEVVLNVDAMLAADFLAVRDELSALVRALGMKSVNTGKGVVLVKVAVETSQLDEKRIRLACKIAEAAGADFVATSTGREGRVHTDEVELLRECLPEAIGVKAAGRIETLADVEAMVGAGAARVGTAQAGMIMSGHA